MILIYNVSIVKQNDPWPDLVNGEVIAMEGRHIKVITAEEAEEVRYNLNLDLKKNLVECLSCHDDVISTTEQPFKKCTCGALWVDGGLVYNKWGSDKCVLLKLVYSN